MPKATLSLADVLQFKAVFAGDAPHQPFQGLLFDLPKIHPGHASEEYE